MSCIFWREVLALKNMPEMSPAISAYYFHTMSIRIWHPFYGSGYFIIETWPSAV